MPSGPPNALPLYCGAIAFRIRQPAVTTKGRETAAAEPRLCHRSNNGGGRRQVAAARSTALPVTKLINELRIRCVLRLRFDVILEVVHLRRRRAALGT